jgi:hypothetical protein
MHDAGRQVSDRRIQSECSGSITLFYGQTRDKRPLFRLDIAGCPPFVVLELDLKPDAFLGLRLDLLGDGFKSWALSGDRNGSEAE